MIGSSGPRTSLLPGAPVAAPPGEPGSGPGRSKRPSRSTLVLAGAGVLVLAAVGGFVLLNNSSGGGDTGGPVATHTTRSGTPSGSATGSGTAAPAVPSTGRNPFLSPPGSSGTTGTGTGTTTATGTTSAGTTGSATATPTTTVTATVTATPLYVGLYGFSGSKGVFWVNDTKYTVAVGGTFHGFTYRSKTSAGCARVSHSGTTTTLCPGTVKQFT